MFEVKMKKTAMSTIWYEKVGHNTAKMKQFEDVF